MATRYSDSRRRTNKKSSGPGPSSRNDGKTFFTVGGGRGVSKQNLMPEQLSTCRAFERGHCRFGPTCRYSHDVASSSSSRPGHGFSRRKTPMENVVHITDNPVRFMRELDNWLASQLTLNAADNIEQLSGEKGLQLLLKIVEERNLSDETITLFVALLAKEELRSSLLLRETNKIYGVLLGSRFLLQLHVHIGCYLGIRTPKPQEVKPYLLLVEELQCRTENGWKEVPLDALQSVIHRLHDSPGKDELVATVTRLLDQREKTKRTLAVAPPDKCLRGAQFREMSIVASKEELLRFQARQDLPVNRIGKRYARVCDYLETHFQLLREDSIDPLRQGIKAYRSNKNGNNTDSRRNQDLRIYSKVQLVGVQCGDHGIEYVVSFQLELSPGSQRGSASELESSKHLMFGSLLCISSDDFQTFIWGVVAGRDAKQLGQCRVPLRLIGESDANVAAAFQSGQTAFADKTSYVMVESTAAYFEAYFHVLKSLQREEMEDIPFSNYLLHLEPKVEPPSYLLRRKRGDEYDFTRAFPDIAKTAGRESIRIMEDWPQGWPADTLDKAQQDALKEGLTKELAIIQGPPGTGKTFLGLTLVKLLLANLKRSPGHDEKLAPRRLESLIARESEEQYDMSGPILVICYTNHALDQFLEGIYNSGETNLIRIGGRGKSEILKDRNLQTLLQRQRDEKNVEGSHRRLRAEGRAEIGLLETQIRTCISVIGLDLVTCHLLEGVSTPEQRQSLWTFGSTGNGDQVASDRNIVKKWLSDARCVDPYMAHHFLSNEIRSGSGNGGARRSMAADDSGPSPVSSSGSVIPFRKRGPKAVDADEWTEIRKGGHRKGAQQKKAVPVPGVKVPHLNVQNRWIPVAQPEHDNDDFEEPGQSNLETVEEDDSDPDVIEPFTGLDQELALADEGFARLHLDAEWDLEADPDATGPFTGLNQGLALADEGLARLHLDTEGKENDATDDHVHRGRRHAEVPREVPLQEFITEPNVWQLTLKQRNMLHEFWLDQISMTYQKLLRELSEEYDKACEKVTEVDNEIKLSLLRKSKVIGMTTTSAARHHDVLKSLKPEIVIVEEAAEVLEGHILACLSPSVKHLILIGDHLQLRPSVAVYRLAIEQNLEVSMFERLVRSGVEHVTLQEQRRMRPKISKLVKSLYPESKDHAVVTEYESVQGMSSNVFFFDHKAEESQTHDSASKVNVIEAKLVVELCLYLLNQGYTSGSIAILSMYTGQLLEIKKILKQRIGRLPASQTTDGSKAADADLPRVSSVDDYQGEESDIIILSLVRSNSIVTNDGEGKIGFLKIPNRVCVALTRAKKGFYIFGNADLLAERSSLWKEVTTTLRDDDSLGPQLELHCQKHPMTKTMISKPEDFKPVEDGGCSLACEYQLDCGHVCPRRCHPTSHDSFICPKPCLRQSELCTHICKIRCHGFTPCPPCEIYVTKELPCGHQQAVKCSADMKNVLCNSACPKPLKCGHRCLQLCGRPCIENCPERVQKMLPCKHSAQIQCHREPASHPCRKPCGAILPDCEHGCGGSCGECKQGTIHIPCQQKCGRNLPCGHLCEAGCSVSCPPCRKKCPKRCVHSVCKLLCGDPCIPCMESCSWRCKHHRCEKRCHEVCTRPRCDEPCQKRLKCKHPCIGLCGDPCPAKCRICHPKTLETVTQMNLEEFEPSDRFVQLTACRHVFEVSGLDTWMDADNAAQQSTGAVAIKPKQCPECRAPIWQTLRYSNVIKTAQARLEEVKRKIRGNEFTRQGNLSLQSHDHNSALGNFMEALHHCPGLMEAHFGCSSAFFAMKKYAKSISHLSFIVERSSFASDLIELTSRSLALDVRAAAFVHDSYGSSTSTATDPLAIRALTQWAAALSKQQMFPDASKLCEAILSKDPANTVAAEIKATAEKNREAVNLQLVVKAMKVEMGGSGHWYTCPNGHYYTIGECGGAMQTSVCPDCKATVGGANHQLLSGNAVASDILQSHWTPRQP